MTLRIVTVYVILAILMLAVSGFFAFLGYRVWHNNPIEAFKSYFRVNDERFYPDRQLRVRAVMLYLVALYLSAVQVFCFLDGQRVYSIAIQVMMILAYGVVGVAGHYWAKKK